MVQSQSLERFDVVPLMTADEARACVARINGHMGSARAELLRLYEGRGWEGLGYATWRECVTTEFGGSERRLYQLLEAAEIERNIAPVLQDFSKVPIPDSQLRPLARLTPIEQAPTWQRAREIAEESGERFGARHVEQAVDDALDPPMELEQVADQFPDELTATDKRLLKTSTPGARLNAGLFASATPEWYTPQHIIKRVVEVFGEIDLDPCSNSREAPNVPALNHYTAADDGLSREWFGRVYMNPPYGDEIPQWVDRLVQAYEGEEINAAIALLPARVDTNWFQPLWNYALCFVKGRLRFSGAENSAPFPSVIVYMGPDVELFRETFEDIGRCGRLL